MLRLLPGCASSGVKSLRSENFRFHPRAYVRGFSRRGIKRAGVLSRLNKLRNIKVMDLLNCRKENLLRFTSFLVIKKLLPRQLKKQHHNPRSGFTLLETAVAIAVLGIFFVAVALILERILINIGESRVRSTALALAQSKMETVRNLPYEDIGTVGGIPAGPLLPTETVTINSQGFEVTSSVIYMDDPFDGTVPQDLINTDYKRVRVEITWGGAYPSRIPVTFATNFAPRGVETLSGGGTLYLHVFDANGQAVPNAQINIDNQSVVPEIHMQTLSNNNGLVVLPGAPACITCYEIQVTKSNYSQDKTYSSTEVANPLQPHATVIEGQMTELSFAIDGVSSVIVNSYGSRELGYPSISNVLFTLKGTKIIGYDTNDEPVYKYSYSTNTGGGTVTISGLEWDTYSFDFSNSAHNLAGSNPMSPFTLTPATALTVPIVAVPKSGTSLLVGVKNSAQELQASSSVQLTNDTLPFIATESTAATGAADFGQVFFGSLTPAVYDLKVSLPGYQDATASLSLSGIHQEIFILNTPL